MPADRIRPQATAFYQNHMKTEDLRKNILDYLPDELETVASELGEKKFRAAQIFGWLAKGVTSFDDMKNIPASLRAALDERFYIGIPEAVRRQESKDGTVKCLFEFPDGTQVESVFMKYEYGNSICISSQSGCRMGCTFCASTMDGLDRSLTGGEMLAQVPGAYYIERCAVDTNANIIKTKKAIKKAFEYEKAGHGFCMIEVLSTCPTNWGLSPVEAMKWLEENMIPYYPLGVYKDKGAEGK